MTDIFITDPSPFEEDIIVEKSLRPLKFDEFIGQKELVDNLKLYIDAANVSEDSLDPGNLYLSKNNRGKTYINEEGNHTLINDKSGNCLIFGTSKLKLFICFCKASACKFFFLVPLKTLNILNDKSMSSTTLFL